MVNGFQNKAIYERKIIYIKLFDQNLRMYILVNISESKYAVIMTDFLFGYWKWCNCFWEVIQWIDFIRDDGAVHELVSDYGNGGF